MKKLPIARLILEKVLTQISRKGKQVTGDIFRGGRQEGTSGCHACLSVAFLETPHFHELASAQHEQLLQQCQDLDCAFYFC